MLGKLYVLLSLALNLILNEARLGAEYKFHENIGKKNSLMQFQDYYKKELCVCVCPYACAHVCMHVFLLENIQQLSHHLPV